MVVLCALLASCGESDPAEPEAGTTTGAASDAGDDGASTSGAAEDTGAGEGSSDDAGSESDSGAAETGAVSGCGTDPGFTGVAPGQLDVDGEPRNFQLVLPDDYDPDNAYPLVFMFHGRGGEGGQLRQYAGVEEASAGEAIFVYPDALPNAKQGGLTGWDLSSVGIDVAFVDALLADFDANLCIDQERVFAAGHSHGGFFSNTLGCFRGDVFRAIGPVAGGGPGVGCKGTVAAWLAHNPDDTTVPIGLGKLSRNHWLESNACGEETQVGEPDVCAEYQGCDDGFDVVWCEHEEQAQGSPHGWPSFAGESIWAFFARY